MLEYFEAVRAALKPDGIFFMDCFGGYESFKVCKESRDIGNGIKYVWDQHDYNPITGEMQCYIGFKFPDGSKNMRAFEYNWRMWTLPEIREILADAGFTAQPFTGKAPTTMAKAMATSSPPNPPSRTPPGSATSSPNAERHRQVGCRGLTRRASRASRSRSRTYSIPLPGPIVTTVVLPSERRER